MLRSTLAIAYRRTARSLAVRPPSLKTGCAEEVGRGHLHAHAGLGQRLLEPLEGRLARDVVGHEVVVVERDGRGAELGEPVHGLDGVEQGADGPPKTSTPCQPTVQRPKLNLSFLVGV